MHHLFCYLLLLLNLRTLPFFFPEIRRLFKADLRTTYFLILGLLDVSICEPFDIELKYSENSSSAFSKPKS